jgi:hypothetical protein
VGEGRRVPALPRTVIVVKCAQSLQPEKWSQNTLRAETADSSHQFVRVLHDVSLSRILQFTCIIKFFMWCESLSFMSEYSRWREWRSTATTAKPTAGHAKCRQPPIESSPPPRARQRLYARALQVRRTRRATHRLLAHVRQVHRLCRAEPPRPAARREPPRLVSWWHARRLNARARQAAVRRRQRRAIHRLHARTRQVRHLCRAEPPRQAARRRLNARHRRA